jgi:carboxypeptidase C (cathepsin A)
MKALTIILYLYLFQSIISSIEDDKVKSIPDYSYRGLLYSGYLDVSPVKKFHYMFNSAYEDADHKPLLLWLNGGPGCSSLDGWANEHGPMQFKDDGKFYLNEFSWNRAANVIYLESPGDVGFSYIDSKLDNDLYIDDDVAAEDNLKALLDFFVKFPTMKNKDFYIAGESYGGIYVPMLAHKIVEYNKNLKESQKINLKGILVGNGVADWNYDTSPAMYDFIFTHHLTSYESRLEYNKYCLLNETFDKQKCKDIETNLEDDIDGINIYDYLRECKIPKNFKGELSTSSKYYKYAPWAFKKFKTTNEKINLQESERLYGDAPCFDDTLMENYFNREDVQKALHVTAKRPFEICSDAVNKRYISKDRGSIWAYPTLIKEGIRILVYSGDTDAIVPFNGNQKWIRNLKLEIEEPWRQWRAYDDMNNVSGYVIKYKGLTFCTIKGTGHMAPMWKPKESFYMLEKFLNEEDF